MGNDKVVQTHGKCQQEAGQNSRHNIRKHHLEKGIEGLCSKIQCRLIAHLRALPKLGQHGQKYIGQIKGNMGNQNGLKAQADFEGNKAKHQRDTGYDIRIQHRHIAYTDNQASGKHLHFPKSHRRHGAQNGGNQGGQKGNHKGILQSLHNVLVLKHFHIPAKTEAGKMGSALSRIKGQGGKHEDGCVEKKHHQTQIGIFQKTNRFLFH